MVGIPTKADWVEYDNRFIGFYQAAVANRVDNPVATTAAWFGVSDADVVDLINSVLLSLPSGDIADWRPT